MKSFSCDMHGKKFTGDTEEEVIDQAWDHMKQDHPEEAKKMIDKHNGDDMAAKESMRSKVMDDEKMPKDMGEDI